MLSRRQFTAGLLTTVMTSVLKGCSHPQPEPPRWDLGAFRKAERSQVAILEAKSYDAHLKDIILRGINLFSLNIKGKTVVIKPNLVEYDPAGVINTHPAVIAAAIDAFRSLDAQEVIVAEGPGHRRDNEYLLTASGLYAVLQEYRAQYVDLDNDNAQAIPVNSYFTGFSRFYFPETVLKADLLVSLPKLKTHHWAGATLSMKNLFGIIPSAVYGWPKNILHQAGIPNSIVDINSSLPTPRFAIVDGIVGMEGNGPIQGQAKHCGVLIFGDDFAAVDATAARVMTLDPYQIGHLASADQFLGNIAQENIVQLGERIESVKKDFEVIPSFQHLKTIAS
jgi:uncharacterized protein (DUF362 family)